MRLLADLVVLLHLAFVLFVVVGGFLAIRWPRLAWVHLPAALWGAAVELTGWICPLTPLEQALRRQAGSGEYAGGFIEHHLMPVLYPEHLTRPVQIALGCAAILINLAAYGLAWRRHRARIR